MRPVFDRRDNGPARVDASRVRDIAEVMASMLGDGFELGDDGRFRLAIDSRQSLSLVNGKLSIRTDGSTVSQEQGSPYRLQSRAQASVATSASSTASNATEAGAQGMAGEDGADGEQGPPGVQGVAGPRGMDGIGMDGLDGEPGLMGFTGAQGAQGAPGAAVFMLQDPVEGEPQIIMLTSQTRPVASVHFHTVSSAQATWTNMPLAAALLGDHHRHVARADLTGYSQTRLLVNKMGTAGVAGAKFILRYRISYSTTAADYSDAGVSEISCAIDATDTYVSSSWIDLVAASKADVWLAIIGTGGDGAVDPQYGSIRAEFR